MKKFYKDYEKAIENEIELDLNSYSLLGKKAFECAFLPRPLKFARFIKRKIYFSGLFSIVLPIAWLFIMPFVFLYKLLFFFKEKLRSAPDIGLEVNAGNTVFLVYSNRALEVFKNHTSVSKARLYIFMPWVNAGIIENKSINLLQMLSYRQLIMVYVLAIYSVLVFYFSSGRKEWTLQTYTVFNWFLVYFAIRDLNQVEFVCAEHYDRWAVLTDLVVTNKRLSDNETTTLTLMQHGLLGKIGTSQGCLNLPYKLKSVSKLFVYNRVAFKYFTDHILYKNHCSLKPEMKLFISNIELSNIDSLGFIASVLFIGNPACERFHISLLYSLQEKLQDTVLFFYKPHPLSPSSSKVNNVNWSIVSEKRKFPFVDLVISYPSTLEQEYAMHGVKTITHSIDASGQEIQDYERQVLSALEKNRRLCE
jgi:hypothetical protein